MPKTTFVDGDPSLGQLGTIVTAAFLNALNNHRHTGLDVDGHGAIDYAVDTGAANAYAIALTPALAARVEGMPIWVKPASTNTGPSTINDGLGAVPLTSRSGFPLGPGAVKKDVPILMMWNGAAYVIHSPLMDVITSDFTLYVDASGSDSTGDGSAGAPWATPHKAIDWLKNKWINQDAIVTIQCSDGSYDFATAGELLVSHPCGRQINIVGDHTYITTVSSVVSATGSAGNWTATLQLASSANVVVGDGIIIKNATGGTLPVLINGCYVVTAVNGNNVTFISKAYHTSYASGAVTADATIIKTVFNIDGAVGDSINVIKVDGSELGLLDKIIINGSIQDYSSVGLTPNTFGINVIFGRITLGTIGITGMRFAVYIQKGAYLESTSLCLTNSNYGLYCTKSSSCLIANSNIVGCSGAVASTASSRIECDGSLIAANSTGLISHYNSVIYTENVTLLYHSLFVNDDIGIEGAASLAQYGGVIYLGYSTIDHNKYGSYARIRGNMRLRYSTYNNNSSIAVVANLGSFISIASLTYSGNGTDITPAINTLSSDDSYING